MISCLNFNTLVIFALLIDTTRPVFLATGMDSASTTGLPRLTEAAQKLFHRNGFHGEIVGFAAKHERECGIVLLDYGSYINGRMFDSVLEKYEKTLSNNSTLNGTLRAKVYSLLKDLARKEHVGEMHGLFERYRSLTPHYNAEQLKFFPGVGILAIGIGIGIGKLVYDGVTSLYHKFAVEELEQSRLVKDLVKVGKQLHDLGEKEEVETSEIRYGFVFSQIRAQLFVAVQNALKELFLYGRVSDRLISHPGEKNLLSAIAVLMGENLFNASMLKKRYFVAGETLRARVLSMNKNVMEVQVCYPITKEEDLGYLMRIVVLGEFTDGRSVYASHKLGRHYIIPLSMNIHNVSTLAEVGDIDDDCTIMSSVLLCKTQLQRNGCALDRNKRQGCAIVTHNSTNEAFTLVEPLLRTTVIATRMSWMSYTADHVAWTKVAIPQPVTVVELPNGALLHVGGAEVKPRVTTGNLTLELNIVIPASDSSLEPIINHYDYDDLNTSTLVLETLSMERLVLLLFTTLFGLAFSLIFHHSRQLESLRRSVKTANLLREAQREPISIVGVDYAVARKIPQLSMT